MKKSLIAIGVGLLVIGNSTLGTYANDETAGTVLSEINFEIHIPDSDEQPKSNSDELPKSN